MAEQNNEVYYVIKGTTCISKFLVITDQIQLSELKLFMMFLQK